MRKKELLHLHSLLHILKRRAEVKYEVNVVAFEEYESLGVSPQQVYKREGEHQKAVMILLELLASELEEETEESSDERYREAVPVK